MPGFIGNTGLVDHGEAKRKLAEILIKQQPAQPARPAPTMDSFMGGMVGAPREAAPQPAMNIDDWMMQMLGMPSGTKRKSAGLGSVMGI